MGEVFAGGKLQDMSLLLSLHFFHTHYHLASSPHQTTPGKYEVETNDTTVGVPIALRLFEKNYSASHIWLLSL